MLRWKYILWTYIQWKYRLQEASHLYRAHDRHLRWAVWIRVLSGILCIHLLCLLLCLLPRFQHRSQLTILTWRIIKELCLQVDVYVSDNIPRGIGSPDSLYASMAGAGEWEVDEITHVYYLKKSLLSGRVAQRSPSWTLSSATLMARDKRGEKQVHAIWQASHPVSFLKSCAACLNGVG